MGLLTSPDEKLKKPMLMINTTYEYGDRVVEALKAKNYDDFKRRDLYAWMMMRDGKYKYIRHFKDDVIEELYDMEKDPDELDNLAVNAKYHKKLIELRIKAVEEFRNKDGDFVDHLPEPRQVSR